MGSQPISLAGADLTARASGALWWEDMRLLCVADLHLGRSERLARRGGALLPPYETAETIDRLAAEIERLGPATVICLGDSFDDSAASDGLDPAAVSRLATLADGRDWVWVAGNHDPAAPTLAGRAVRDCRAGPLTFRHAAVDPVDSGEVSGHYHPKLRFPVRGRSVSRRCFLYDDRRLILPAFGAYTGGLHVDSPALARLLAADARAVVTGEPCVTLPAVAPPAARSWRPWLLG
jgi:DNA ligase-associated metallophosphoesterase